jgi:acetoin utilization deacetylase AcuC-like enzyme
MNTLLITHPSGLQHLTPLGHPERPDRLRALEQVFEQEKFQDLIRVEAPSVPLETITLCHPMDYVEALRHASPKEGIVAIDADTSMSPGSFEAAVRAVGGAVHAVNEVVGKRADNAFVCMRPPGHHTETARAMGFCLFNTAAIAARYAQDHHGLDRVAVIDFDVHHGNGTQDIFWADPKVMYCSTHQMPLYPGTGAVSEAGEHNNIVNAPLRAGDGGDKFREAFETRIIPALLRFRPELVIISAGFDAHRRDPLANLQLVEDDFSWATRVLMEIADKTAGDRVISVLEGGYDLEGLSQSAAAHVTALMHG